MDEFEKAPGAERPLEAAEDDKELIRRSAEGDMEAFAALVRRKRLRVYRLAARICGPEEADDVTQVVFLRLWRHIHIFRDSGTVDRWLTRVAVNRAIDAARHVGRRLKLVARGSQGWSPTPVEESLMRGEITQVFTEMAERLGERQRAAFSLRELEGYDTKEVARILGVSKSTVRNLVRQARQGLRKALREQFPEYSPDEPSGDAANE
jgi:RNA polymerase sigma-70 factor (ECF subfamily)